MDYDSFNFSQGICKTFEVYKVRSPMLKNAKVLNVNLHWEGSSSLSRQPLWLKRLIRLGVLNNCIHTIHNHHLCSHWVKNSNFYEEILDIGKQFWNYKGK
jgi:hypothetical protein